MAATQIDLQNYPAYRAKILEVVQELSFSLNALSNTRFYMTGGAAAEFLLANAHPQPIYDIDCVCLINPVLTEAEHKAAREHAIATAAGILKRHLEGPMPPQIAAETAAMVGVAISPLGFNSNYSRTANYNPFTEPVMIPAGSPFTGIYYYDRRRKIYVLSIRHRTAYMHTEMQSLLDVSFPARDYDRYADKWRESGFLRELTKNEKAFKTLTPIWLAANQQYAANHTNNSGKKTRRLNRVRQLSEKFPGPKVTGPLPVVHATIARRGPSAGATGGGSAAAAPSLPLGPPPPDYVIQQTNTGRIYLINTQTNTRINHTSYNHLEDSYTFPDGFRGRIGDQFWRHADGGYYPYPPY
jgi:hypothetical protein